MAYLFIILAMVLVIGPIFWIRPSPKERRLAKYRALALQNGVKVEPISLVSDQQYAKVAERNLHVSDYKWVRYRRICKEGEVGPDIRGQWTQRKDREGKLLWEPFPVTLEEPAEVAEYLDRWREAQDYRFLALEFGPRTVSVVWTEEGDENELGELFALLEALGAVE